MTTSTRTVTRTQTATHLSGVVLGSTAEIVAHLGIDPQALLATWGQDEKAITAWIEEGSLAMVVLECHRPGGRVDPVVEFPVCYDVAGSADAQFTADQALLARYLAKLRAVPAGTTHRLFVTFNGPRTPQPGWGSGRRASTEGLRSTSFGTIAGAPHASASVRYLRA